jgi:alpha-amylase/alpha-mannosidase (GH57 family)
MKYITILHANLNYAYLPERRYEFVIRNSYELIFDTYRTQLPNDKYVFEASGYTIEQMALKTPDVLAKLKAAIKSGQCEFMGSPYAHPMLPNFPEEDGNWSIRFSNEAYQKYLGLQPKSFWNPECGWRSYVKDMVLANGYKNLLAEFEQYSRSVDAAGQPLRPEIYAAEKIDNSRFYNFEFKYNLPGDERGIHFPFQNVEGLPGHPLRVYLRTDRIAVFGVRYFMSHPGHSLENYLKLIKKFSAQKPGEPEGAMLIYADDAEYIGTNAWYKLKYCNDPDQIFEKMPDAQEKLVALVKGVRQLGSFTTFDDACRHVPPLADKITFDDNMSWHGGQASNWANTPMARLLRPWQDLVRAKLKKIEGKLDPEIAKRVWFHLTNSYNSDGQWPPTTKASPHIIYPFNYKYNFENLLAAENLLGGVDRSRIDADPRQTMKAIFTMQQDLVLAKAAKLLKTGSAKKKKDAAFARGLILRSRDMSSVPPGTKVLYPSEYEVRANALILARELVGGIIVAGDK